MKGKTFILAMAAAAIAAPMATAGADRDSVLPATSLVSEKTDGLWRAPESSSPLVSEKTDGLFPVRPVSAVSAPVVVPDGSGFDWSAAAIGAGGTLAFLLAASTGAFAMRRRGMLAH